MYWSDADHLFCEHKILGSPEYINSITSGFIILFGIYGFSKKNDIFIDIIYALLIITGIGSTGYHFTGNIGWALFDEIPMILCIFVSIIYVDVIQKSNKFKLFANLFLTVLFIICNTLTNYRQIFPYIYASIMFYFYYSLRIKSIYINNAILTIVISVIIWGLTEISCNYIQYYILLLGHPLWHFCIGHGFYNLIQAIYFTTLKNYDIIKYNRFYLLDIES
jgi:hypothetical protein